MPTERKYTLLTCMNSAILEATGRRMLESVLRRWPGEVDLVVAFEGDVFEVGNFSDEYYGRVTVIDLMKDDPDIQWWMDKYKRHPGQDWFKKCAWRFAYKSFAVTRVGLEYDCDVLIWLDADTYAYSDIALGQLAEWMPPGKTVTYLGRSNFITECGFVMYDTRHAGIQRMLSMWRELYTSGDLFLLPGWNDCYAFDRCREEKVSRKHWNNLTPWGRGTAHVFVNGPIGKYMDHMKGVRKETGKSLERDIIDKRVSNEFLDYLRAT